MLADVWIGKPIILIDRLGDDFLSVVSDGGNIQVADDGVVTILPVIGVIQ